MVKGAVGNFGAGPAYQAALELERAGHEEDPETIQAALVLLEAELQRLEPHLRALIQEENVACP